jgi:hypothetical protein
MSRIWIWILLSGISVVESHVRWSCPSPRSQDSGLKNGPCGSVYTSDNPPTVVSPGPFPLVFQETIFHTGSPFRIALAPIIDLNGSQVQDQINAFESCVLLDHIPHNDAGTANQYYSVTVNIPNVNCTNCVLQVIQVMTDKIGFFSGGSTCTYNGSQSQSWSNGFCGSNYHSCANVIINGTQPFNVSTACPTIPPSGWAFNATPNSYTSADSGNWDPRGVLADTRASANFSVIPQGTTCTAFSTSINRVASGMLSTGAIIGIVLAILIILGIAAYVAIRFRKRWKKRTGGPSDANLIAKV